jgi:hypothetical protein
MKSKNLTPEELKEQNERIAKECNEYLMVGQEERKAEVSKALSHLLGVVEAETIDVKFESTAGEAVLKIRANPPQKTLKEIQRISDASVNGDTSKEDELKMCELMEYLTIDPVIPAALWESGEVPEEIAVKIIMALGISTIEKQEERERELKNFREKRGRAKTTKHS